VTDNPRPYSNASLAAAKSSRKLQILFVCSRNRIRSLTAELIFASHPGVTARSGGTQENARIRVSDGHIHWADLVVCMETSHLRRLELRFPEALSSKRVVVLHIPDDFEFMQPELVDEIEFAMSKVLS
jgi:predicted protein tyrosine phosphatase